MIRLVEASARDDEPRSRFQNTRTPIHHRLRLRRRCDQKVLAMASRRGFDAG